MEKILYIQTRQILCRVTTIRDNVGIGGMGTDKVNTFILQKIQVAGIPFSDDHRALGAFVFKIRFFLAAAQGRLVNIYANYIAIKQLCFDQSGATTGKLIQNPIIFF